MCPGPSGQVQVWPKVKNVKILNEKLSFLQTRLKNVKILNEKQAFLEWCCWNAVISYVFVYVFSFQPSLSKLWGKSWALKAGLSTGWLAGSCCQLGRSSCCFCDSGLASLFIRQRLIWRGAEEREPLSILLMLVAG